MILAGSLDPELETPDWYNTATGLPGIELKMPGLYQVANAEIAAAKEQTGLLSAVLDRITCPVRIIHGTADNLVPAQNTEYIARAMTRAASLDAALIEGEGHAVHIRCANAVREAIFAIGRGAPIPR